ncbi:hypothetical protein Cs7R123_62670 [Catellatospora sp. TT07R-123]|uniref:carboxypeptidase-like regulatory domain-containing protein n=1 Tax=Catellatospora sp. TT07R-123 TaxID=2733863 RepID=UPI001AFF8D3E|nr:carboxypeptidase-like regulatory domain-containing protein [Catellatospora sp. TT07R-123]GHJ48925.1 hypothetical protein Cs7R123_62670 [Catellatospora sp. TT07R-123]
MRRNILRRFGSALLAVTVAVTGLVTPAHADPGTGAISGHLTAEGGAPVADAWVEVSGAGYGNTRTDENGYYRVENLAPGSEYRVFFFPAGRLNQYAHQTTDWEQADTFTVVDGGETVVDDSLIPVGYIAGRFTAHDGTPLTEGSVELLPVGSGSHQWAEIGPDGRYRAALLPGSYQVSFSGYRSQAQWVPGKPFSTDAAVFTVAVGQTVQVDDAVAERAVVTGHITRPDGSPAVQVSVSLSVVSGAEWGLGTETDGDGAYRIEAWPGQYRVAVYSDGFGQYVPQRRIEAQGTVFDLAADSVTTVDETVLGQFGYGVTLRGRLTGATGQGVAGVEVRLETDWGSAATVHTDAGGYWIASGLPASTYLVRFSSPAQNVFQYAYGKPSQEEATRFFLQEGQTVVVNDTVVPVGSIRVTAKDAVTGAAIGVFDAMLGERQVSAEQGAAVLGGVPAGQYEVSVSAEGYQYGRFPAAVAVGAQTELEVTLTPYAHITTTVVDSVTGEPVAGVCVFPATRQSFRTWEGCPGESGPDGRLTLDHVDPGTVQLFVLAAEGSAYGAQWFGKNGLGTGSQLDARSFTLAPGETRQIQKIRMDRAGTVTGLVTGADSQPVTEGEVSVVTPTIGNGTRGAAPIDGTGHYTISWLGPYQWPLQFRTAGHAWQWSGGIAKRHDAVKVSVVSDQTTVFDQQLKRGTLVRVTVTGGPDGGEQAAFNVATGDLAALGYAEMSGDEVSLLILGGQQVKLQLSTGSGDRLGWYGGTGFASATSVPITPTGPATLTYAFS